MANWPIQTTKRTMPGTSTTIRSNLDYNTNAGMVARALGEMGNKFEELHIKQAYDQLSTAKLQSMQDETQFASDLNKEMDESKYDAMLSRFEASQNKLNPKNPLGAKLWNRYNIQQSLARKKNTEDAKHDRLANKWEVKRDGLAAEAEQDYAKMTILKGHLAVGIGARYTEQAEGERFFQAAKELAQYKEATRRVRANPEGYLDSLKKGKPPILEDLDTVVNDPLKMMAVRNNAEGRKSEIEIEKGRITLKQTAAIKKAAAGSDADIASMEAKISQSDALTVEQKITAMKEFNATRRVMAKGGNNAYTTTENWELYVEYRRRAASKTITEKEIIDKIGPDGYSHIQGERLLSILKGTSSSAKAFEESASAETLKELITGIPLVEGGEDIEGNPLIPVSKNTKFFATKMGYRMLEDKFNDHPDWTAREKDEEAIKVFNRLERMIKAGEIEIKAENLPKTPETLEQRSFAKKGLAPGEFKKPKGMPSKKTFTDKDYAALKSGDEFTDPETGKKYRKP